MLSAVPKKWFVLRDRNSNASGTAEAIALLRIPQIAGGIDDPSKVEVEYVGDVSINDKGAKIQYRGAASFDARAHWMFQWGKDAEDSFSFAALMDGRYANQGIAGATRMYMVITELEDAEAENLLAMDTLDYYDCTGINSKEGKDSAKRTINIEMLFQGRDPLSKEED